MSFSYEMWPVDTKIHFGALLLIWRSNNPQIGFFSFIIMKPGLFVNNLVPQILAHIWSLASKRNPYRSFQFSFYWGGVWGSKKSFFLRLRIEFSGDWLTDKNNFFINLMPELMVIFLFLKYFCSNSSFFPQVSKPERFYIALSWFLRNLMEILEGKNCQRRRLYLC